MKNFSLQPNPFALKALPFWKIGFFLGTAFFGQWFISDLIHFPGGGVGLLIFGGGALFLLRPSKPLFETPETVQGWIKRCHEVLGHFEVLEGKENFQNLNKKRSIDLQEIIARSEPQTISFASTKGVSLPEEDQLLSALSISSPFSLYCSPSLPLHDNSWSFPQVLINKDLLVYFLPLPLRAVDMIWLENIPDGQPSWVMVSWADSGTWNEQLNALKAQLPERWNGRILRWNGSAEDIKEVLLPVKRSLAQPRKNIDLTRQRMLSRLHSSWQSELEKLRRNKFQTIQNRSQWIVAGAVFASPVPSGDLLALAAVNGLMVKEMAEIWSCEMKPELLQVVAKKLATAAIAEGVVEWSGQALLGVAKLDGSGWFAAGTMQALSAAYLTRVVGRSMADWMALNNGVSEPDLALLNQQVPSLISNAVEKERIDWSGFLKQSKSWIDNQTKDSKLGLSS